MPPNNQNEAEAQNGPSDPVLAYIHRRGEKLMAALPRTFRAQFTAAAFVQAVALMFEDPKKGPNLRKCSPDSIYAALLTGIRYGLDPSPSRQLFAIVPYGNAAQFQLMYKGMLELAYRTGLFEEINPQAVFDGDTITLDKATGEVSQPMTGDDFRRVRDNGRGELIGSYCVTKLKGMRPRIEVAVLDDIEKAKRNTPAWENWDDQQAIKFVLKRALKFVPGSTDLASALAADVDGMLAAAGGQSVSAMPPARRDVIDSGVTPKSRQLPAPQVIEADEDVEADLAALKAKEAERVRAAPSGDGDPPFGAAVVEADDAGGMP